MLVRRYCEILPLTVLKITLLGRPLFQQHLRGDVGLKARVKEFPLVIAGRENLQFKNRPKKSADTTNTVAMFH